MIKNPTNIKVSKKKRKLSERNKDHGIAATSQARGEEKRRGLIKWYQLLLAAIVITLLSYGNSVTNQFVFDDIHIILNNPSIRGIEKIPYMLGIGRKHLSYRPVRMVSYAIDYTLNKKVWRSTGGYRGDDKGLNPFGYHISNIAYHVVTSLLVFLVIVRLVSDYRVAFLATTFFTLHPVHTDSVTYLSGRRDILCALFYLAGFYFFLRYREARRIRFIIGSFVSYLLALGSKEMAVTLPAVFLCYDVVKGFDTKTHKINLTYFKDLMHTLKMAVAQSRYLYALIFLGGLSFSYYKVFIKSPSHRDAYYGDSILTTFFTMGKVVAYYMKLLIYPIRLNADYSYNAFPLSSSLFEPSTFLSFVGLGVVGYGLLRLLISHRIWAFGAIWFFVTLLPVCQIFPHHELLAEHYLYLPSFGFCLLAALCINEFLKEKRYAHFTYVIVAGIALFFSLRIVDRNRDWVDSPTFWEKTIATVSQCARAHLSLGVYYEEKGKLDEAVSQYTQAIAIHPRFDMAYYNLGRVYTQKGKLDEAITEYKRALAIRPFYAEAQNNLGVAYAMKGRLDEAVSQYTQAIAINPRFDMAYYNLGRVYTQKGKLDEAITEYTRALAIRPFNAEARYNLGNTYVQKGRLDEAITEYTRALAIRPQNGKAENGLAIAYFKKKQYSLAMKHLDNSIKLGYNVNPELLRFLLPYR